MDEKDDIDQQDRNIINQGITDTKRKATKEANKLKKKVMAVIRKIVIPMLIAALKVLLPILMLLGMIALFTSILDGGGSTSGDETVIYSTDDYVVNIEMENAAPVLDEEQLETVIEALYEGDAQANLLSAMDSLMDIQETYNVNAVFAIAVFQIESSCRN